MKYVIASGNPHKISEIGRILAPFGIDAISKNELDIFDDPEETGSTFEENAYIKAYDVFCRTGMPSVADDSGLCVNALDGAPGVYSARYAGEGASDAQKIQKLLSELSTVDSNDRSAVFVSAVCCVFSKDDFIIVRGECRGNIAYEPDGDGGFGYDPVFVVDGQSKTYARLSGAEKDACSHRGNALRLFEAELKKRIKKDD